MKHRNREREKDMTEEELKLKINDHDHEIKSLKHRVEKVENQGGAIQELLMNVQRLALTMESMLKEQERQTARLNELEKEPGDNWKFTKKTILSTIITVIVTAALTAIIILAAEQLK